MFANAGARKSMDSLSPVSPHNHRQDFPFHSRQNSVSAYPSERRGSTASSIHSIGGALDFSASGVFESGQNAISTLLQPPIVRTGLLPHTSAPASSSHKPPTARDIPPVTLTNIPHVDASEFRSYLSQVGALYEQLRRAKEAEEEGDGAPRKGSKQEDSADGHDANLLRPGKQPPRARKGSSSSIPTLMSPIEAPSPIRRSSSSFAKRAAQGPPPLSTIPTVYFDEDFHLENPRTFDVVSEKSEVIQKAPGDKAGGSNGSASAPRKALATNAILQEKLSWYMDTIEMHLISSISTASTTFFTALGSLKGLHTEAAESVERIKTLRKELAALDEEVATRGLTIVQQRRRRENLQQLHSAVLQLRDIVEGVGKCEALVEQGQVEQALDDIDSLELLMAGQVEPFNGFNRPFYTQYELRDLRGASALQGVNDDIQTLRTRIGRAYEGKLIELLLGDLRRHLDAVSNQEVLMRWSSASMRAKGGHGREPSAFPSYLQNQEELRDRLQTIIGGLQRARHLSAATTAYREVALREIRNLVRRPLPSSNDDDNESMMSTSTMGGARRGLSRPQKSEILRRNLEALAPEDAEELLIKIYIGVTETLRRLTTQGKLLLDVASTIGMDDDGPAGLKSPPLRSPPFSPPYRRASVAGLEAQEEIHKALELSNLLVEAVDVSQDNIVKVLRARNDENTHLPLVWFLRYFTLNLHFANECESISGRSGTKLRSIVDGQIKSFVQSHGDGEQQKLAQGMESDRWDACDFGDRETELLSRVLECSTRDAEAWSEGSKVWIPYSPDDEENQGAGGQAQANGASAAPPPAKSKSKKKKADVEGEAYLLPRSAVLCLEGMLRFLHLAVGIPYITADVAKSLVDYLQLYNSRCKQLILGAGATRSAGLKNINTGHMTLASQALGFVAALVPHLREFVRRRGAGPNTSSPQIGGPASTIMGDFDKVRRNYQEHENAIYDKLIEIMSGRAALNCRKMATLDWDADAAAAAGEEELTGNSTGAHADIKSLISDTTKLYNVLVKHLSEGTVRFIMFPVFTSYRDQLGKLFSDAEVNREWGRTSMIRDVEYLQSQLGHFHGFEDTAGHLLGIIKAKRIVAPVPAPAPDPVPSPPAAAESTTEDGGGPAQNGKQAEGAAASSNASTDSIMSAEKDSGADEKKDEEKKGDSDGSGKEEK